MSYRIAIDIDSVIADTTGTIVNFLREEYEYSITIEDFKQYRIEDNESVEHLHALRALEWFYSCGAKDVPVINGARDYIEALSENNYVLLFTSRPKRLIDDTIAWLMKNGILYNDLLFVEAKRKASYAVDNLIDLVIEDRLDTALECAQHGVMVFLIEYPWNVGAETENNLVKVCSDWTDVYEKICFFQSLIPDGPLGNTLNSSLRWRRDGVYFGDTSGLLKSGSDIALKLLIGQLYDGMQEEFEVLDLCCGNGICLCAWGEAGFGVIGIEANRIRCGYSELNIFLRGLRHCSVHQGDVVEYINRKRSSKNTIIHFDPDWGPENHTADARKLIDTRPDVEQILHAQEYSSIVIRLPAHMPLSEFRNSRVRFLVVKCTDKLTDEAFLYAIADSRINKLKHFHFFAHGIELVTVK